MSVYQTQLEKHWSKHARRGILLDTNILLLLIFSRFLPEQVGQRRLAAYRTEDAELLAGFVSRFSRILTTAHVLAETSNLAGQVVSGRHRQSLFAKLFPLFCSGNSGAFEERRVKKSSLEEAVFRRLGFTDAALVSANRGHLLVTDDLDLFWSTQQAGGDAINFSHMREAAGLI